MKKLITPVVLILMGTGAAFATKANSTSTRAVVDAYRIDAKTGACLEAEQQCDTVGQIPCVWNGDNSSALFEKASDNPTMCGDELFRIN
jgi:hypothetical protein